jgi:hypothetical protein
MTFAGLNRSNRRLGRGLRGLCVTATPVAPSNTAVASLPSEIYETLAITPTGETWANSPTSFAYQWEWSADGTTKGGDVGSATSASYSAAADVSMRWIRRKTIASNAAGDSSPAYSAWQRVKLNWGELYNVHGDGIGSLNGCPGQRNFSDMALAYLDGRVLPNSSYMGALSGGVTPEHRERIPYGVGQKPGVLASGNVGHNPVGSAYALTSGVWDVMAQDSDSDASALNAWKAFMDDIVAGAGTYGAAGSAKIVILQTTVGSTNGAESTAATLTGYPSVTNRGQKANQQQKDYINSIIATKVAAGDPRFILWDAFPLYTPSSMSPSADTQRVHPDERGGDALGYASGGLGPVLAQYLRSGTRSQVLDAMYAGTYPNVEPLRLFAFMAAPAAGTSITVNGHTIGFVTSGATGQQVNTSGSAATTVTNLVTYINANSGSITGNPTAEKNGAMLTIANCTSFSQTSGGTAPADVLQVTGSDTANAARVAGTTGLITNSGIADGCTITNNVTSGISITASKGGSGEQIISISGTAGAGNTISFQETTTFAIPGSYPGALIQLAIDQTIESASGGVPTALDAMQLGTGNHFIWGSNGATSTPTGDLARSYSNLFVAHPMAMAGATYPYLGRGESYIRLSTAAADIKWTIRRRLFYRVKTRNLHAPLFLNQDQQNASATQLRLATVSGTVSGANLIVRIEGGQVAPQGLLNTDFTAKRIYKGAICKGSITGSVLTITSFDQGGSGAGAVTNGWVVQGPGIPAGTTIASPGTGSGGVGTYNLNQDCGTVTMKFAERINIGTLVATITATTLPWNWTASGISAGDPLWVAVDATNGVGTGTGYSIQTYSAP